jgi:hypothetical protein
MPTMALTPKYPQSTTGWYRLYNPATGEHFYTVDYQEAFALRDAGTFRLEGVEGKVFQVEFVDSVALYRLYNPTTNRHFYTTSIVELDIVTKQGFYLEGVQGFLTFTSLSPDGSEMGPLYRLYNVITNDHFYTKSFDEAMAAERAGYVREGDMGRVSL